MYIVEHNYILLVVFDDIHIYHLACSCYLTTQRGLHTSKCALHYLTITKMIVCRFVGRESFVSSYSNCRKK